MIKRIITLSLTAIACLTMQAQTNNDVVTLAKSSGYWAVGTGPKRTTGLSLLV